MKNILLIIGLFIGLNLHAKEITIVAKVMNPTHREFAFSYTVDDLLEENKLTIANLNDNNEIYFILDFKSPTNITTVEYGDYSFDIFIENNDKIEFQFDGNDILNTLKFAGVNAANNNALTNFRKQFSISGKKSKYSKGYLTTLVPNEFITLAKSKDLSSYEQKISQNFQQKMLFAQKTTGVSAAFKTYLNQKISYGTGTARMAYFIINEETTSIIDIERAEVKHEFRSKNQQSNTAISQKEYTNFWITYVYFSYLRKSLKEPNPVFGFYSIAEKQLHGETRDWVLAKIFINAKKENYYAIGDRKFEAFKKIASERKYIDKIAKFYDGILEVTDEGAAPEFSYKDETGKTRSLSEFKGQVVYISYWATWCKPCLMGFKKTVAVRNQMKDLGVILLNVSLDESETMWRNTMKRVPMPGINLMAGNDETLKLDYNLSKLPAYYIIDKKGDFAYLPEGSRDILAEFRKLVNE
jgi:peroxiredoxin